MSAAGDLPPETPARSHGSEGGGGSPHGELRSELATFFAKPIEEQAAELRTLAEDIGALTPSRPPRPFSPVRMFVEAFIVTSLAIGFGWLIWQHWHSILAGLVPIVLIFGRALRWRRVVTSMDRRNPPS